MNERNLKRVITFCARNILSRIRWIQRTKTLLPRGGWVAHQARESDGYIMINHPVLPNISPHPLHNTIGVFSFPTANLLLTNNNSMVGYMCTYKGKTAQLVIRYHSIIGPQKPNYDVRKYSYCEMIHTHTFRNFIVRWFILTLCSPSKTVFLFNLHLTSPIIPYSWNYPNMCNEPST